MFNLVKQRGKIVPNCRHDSRNSSDFKLRNCRVKWARICRFCVCSYSQNRWSWRASNCTGLNTIELRENDSSRGPDSEASGTAQVWRCFVMFNYVPSQIFCRTRCTSSSFFPFSGSFFSCSTVDDHSHHRMVSKQQLQQIVYICAQLTMTEVLWMFDRRTNVQIIRSYPPISLRYAS